MDTLFLSPIPPERQSWLRFKGSTLAKKTLKALGWKVDWHGLPAAHGVIIAYPHTSNWDFVVGILVKWAVGIPLRFWAKEALFEGLSKYTLGPLMRYWGGVPVNRHAASGMIDDTLSIMRRTDFFWLALAPEGTRSQTPYWRSGFYRVAVAANCPVGLAYFDFKHKVVGVSQFVTLTGDEGADLAVIADYYAQTGHGCNPEQAGAITFKR